MTEVRSFFTLGAVTALVAGGVVMSASLDRRPRVTEAVAAVIKNEFAWYSDAASMAASQRGQKPEIVTVCIDAEALDYTLMAERLASTFTRPVPVKNCKSKAKDADPTELGAVGGWSDENGAFAVKLRVRSVECVTRSRCIVETAFMGEGKSYEVKQANGKWAVTDIKLRVIA